MQVTLAKRMIDSFEADGKNVLFRAHMGKVMLNRSFAIGFGRWHVRLARAHSTGISSVRQRPLLSCRRRLALKRSNPWPIAVLVRFPFDEGKRTG